MVLRKLRPTRAGCCRLISSMMTSFGVSGFGLVEHHTLVAGLLEHRRERHDADGREAHHPNTAVLCTCFSREGVELWVANVDEENFQTDSLIRFRSTLREYQRSGHVNDTLKTTKLV